MCFGFWSKTHTKRYTTNSLLKQLVKSYFWQNNFILGWVDRSHAFDFRICLGKTSAAFDFNEKLVISKDFLPLLFAVDHRFSISGYNLKNGRMLCKQKHWIKNMVEKIPILILLRFCLICWLQSVSVVVTSCCN